MNKAMYIPKWQESRFENLTCDRIVVNGSLHVDGRLKTKHISGNGFIYAKWITASSITANTVDADIIGAETLAAAHVYAYDVHATQSMAVSSLIKANYVKTGRIAYCDSEILNLDADEAVKLAPKRRSLLRVLFASFISAKWVELTTPKQRVNCSFEDDNDEDQQKAPYAQDANVQAAYQAAEATTPELEEAARLMRDPEFLKVKALYRLTQETGDIWQLVPKAEPTDRAVTAFQPFAVA